VPVIYEPTKPDRTLSDFPKTPFVVLRVKPADAQMFSFSPYGADSAKLMVGGLNLPTILFIQPILLWPSVYKRAKGFPVTGNPFNPNIHF
jgi:hypothetical protein